jgi:hypothetical protein
MENRTMRDSDIVESFEHESGALVARYRTSGDVRAEFPWMPEFRWSATHPAGWPQGIANADTPDAAIAKLLVQCPDLRRAA